MVDSGDSAPSEGLGSALEWLGLRFHGHSITHIDSLGHVFWSGRAYNGREARVVNTRDGATFGSIEALGGSGIVSRGLLLDIPRSEGRECLAPGEAISPLQLARCEESESITVSRGDILFVRTGRERLSKGEAADLADFAGLDARCLPWLHEREISVLGSDAVNDVTPSGYEGFPAPIHAIGISAMGLWLVDNVSLERLASECARREQWHYCVVLAPLQIQGGTGSPVNPLAIF
jgi:kynurenine formamidase